MESNNKGLEVKQLFNILRIKCIYTMHLLSYRASILITAYFSINISNDYAIQYIYIYCLYHITQFLLYVYSYIRSFQRSRKGNISK